MDRHSFLANGRNINKGMARFDPGAVSCPTLVSTVPYHVFYSYKYYNVRMNLNFIFMKRLNVYIFTDRKCTLAMLLGKDCLWITKCKARDRR